MTVLFGAHLATHLHVRAHTGEATSEKVVIVVEEASERIAATKEVLEYFLCTVHVKVVKVLIATLKAERASLISTSSISTRIA